MTGVTSADTTTTTKLVAQVTKDGQSVKATYIDLDTQLSTGSTNPVQNKVITQVILDNEEVVAAALNDLNERKADKTYVDEAIENIDLTEYVDNSTFNNFTGSTLNGVTSAGTGNVVGSIEKAGTNVKANMIDVPTRSEFNSFTASTETDLSGKADKSYVDTNFVHSVDYTTSGTSHVIVFKDASGNTIDHINADDFIKDGMVDNVQISGTSLVITFNTDSGKSPISIPLSDIFNPNNYYTKSEIDAATASTLTGVTSTAATSASTFVSAMIKDGQNVKFTTVPIDDTLSSSSTRPVQNQAITNVIIENEQITAAALNDLNNRKANIEDVPVTINDLDGSENIAMKSDLAGFLPLSGGTMTGNISGSTGNAIFMPGGFFQESDERLKIFMGDIEGALDKANAIPTKYFYWKNMPDGPRQLGTSAQKVQEIFPEIVSGEEKLAVDYSKLAIVALAAVKELTAKVEDLQKQLDELKK